MTNNLIRPYTGDDILKIPEESYIPIVENILYKNDLAVAVGKYKSNKSILAMQLTCSTSSGTPFLNMFEVPTPQIVWYFSTEGKDNEIKDRFLRMSKIIPTNLENIILFCSTQFKFNTDTGIDIIKQLVKKYKDKLPSLIVIDSLYSGFKGTLIKDDQMNEFITVVRGLMEACNNSACFITTHMTKESVDANGKPIPQTSNNAYGSVFLLGQADHVFTIEKCRKNGMERIISCTAENQRSGNIIEKVRVLFNEPSPLYLSLIPFHKEEEHKITKLLSAYKEGLSAKELKLKSKIKQSLLYMVLNEMVGDGKIVKSETYSGKYTLKGDN